ncbi:MAG: hypothetical protein ACOCU8_00130 [Patescibacteria group bacterium]
MQKTGYQLKYLLVILLPLLIVLGWYGWLNFNQKKYLSINPPLGLKFSSSIKELISTEMDFLTIDNQEEDITVTTNPSTEINNWSGDLLAGNNNSPLLLWSEADYDKIQETDNIFLVFMAEWDLLSQKELETELIPAWDEKRPKELVGIVVPWGQKTTTVKKISDYYEVGFQLTKVLKLNDQVKMRDTNPWQREDYFKLWEEYLGD